MSYIGVGVLLVIVAAFVWRAFARTRMPLTNRREALFEAADTVTALVVGWAIIPWGETGVAWWFVATLGVAAGLGGIVMRWADLPLLAATARPGVVAVWSAIHVVVLVAIVMLVFG